MVRSFAKKALPLRSCQGVAIPFQPAGLSTRSLGATAGRPANGMPVPGPGFADPASTQPSTTQKQSPLQSIAVLVVAPKITKHAAPPEGIL